MAELRALHGVLPFFARKREALLQERNDHEEGKLVGGPDLSQDETAYLARKRSSFARGVM